MYCMKLYTDEDIEGVMRYMAIFHPEKANETYCQALLEYCEMTLIEIATNRPEDIEKIIEVFERSKTQD